MALSVLFVSGPRRAGKSTVVQRFITNCGPRRPHYLRLTSTAGDKRQPCRPSRPDEDCGVRSARWIEYDDDRAFELIPSVLGEIHAVDRKGLVVIEADADPTLRHAYPYDHRLFVMPAPQRTSEVFRTREQASDAFHAALNDTAAFAREIYGLVDDERFDDGGSEPRSELDAAQLRALMNSGLGDELATRILLQSTHHGLIEGDVVVVNTAVGGTSDVVTQCVRRLQRVLEHIRTPDGRRPVLYACDPADADDPLSEQLYRRLGRMLDCDGIPERAAPSEHS